ncbi:MAG: DUF58 domain-containing protein [Burkholderiaceae bacterium]
MFGWLHRTERRARADRSSGSDDSARPAAGLAGTETESSADALLRRIEWTVLRRLDGALQGDHRTLHRGSGLDLADLREYQPHDDVRHIDWNATARTGVPHVREFREDREIAIWFLVDHSASVAFGTPGRTKRSLAAESVGALGRMLVRHGNRVGSIVSDGSGTSIVPARGGRRHLLRLLEPLMRPPREPVRGGEGTTDLAVLLAEGVKLIRRRSQVFVLSDFISLPGWQQAIGELARRHEVIAVRLYDPAEQMVPDLGFVVMQDAETGEQISIDTHDPLFRSRFETMREAREAELRDGLAAAGVDTLELSTDEPLDAALLRFVVMRRQRSRLAAGINRLDGRARRDALVGANP